MIPSCSSRSTSATRRPSSGCSTASSWPSSSGSAPTGAHTGDELARAAARVRRPGGAGRDLLCSSVPPLVREYEAFAERWAGRRLLVARAGRLDRRHDPLRRPARGGARPDRERGRGAASATARRRSSSTSAPRPTSTSSTRHGEFAGGVLAPGDRDLDGRALRPRGAAAAASRSSPGARDRPDDASRRCSRGSSTASRARSTRSSSAIRASSASRRRSSRPAGSPT